MYTYMYFLYNAYLDTAESVTFLNDGNGRTRERIQYSRVVFEYRFKSSLDFEILPVCTTNETPRKLKTNNACVHKWKLIDKNGHDDGENVEKIRRVQTNLSQ